MLSNSNMNLGRHFLVSKPIIALYHQLKVLTPPANKARGEPQSSAVQLHSVTPVHAAYRSPWERAPHRSVAYHFSVVVLRWGDDWV